MAMPLPVTSNQAETVARVKAAVRNLLEKGAKITDLARKIGYSHSALSMFVRDKYDSYELAATAETVLIRMGVLEPVGAIEADLASGDFLATADALDVLGLCHQVWTEREIGVLIGPAGAGKTTSLREYCRRNSGSTCYLRADVSFSTAELLVELGRTLGMDFSAGISLRSMVRAIIARLNVTPRLIVVDEADLLVSGTTRKMEILRTIFDESDNCALLLAGMPRLQGLLTRGPSLRENLAQFYSRVAYMRRLQGLCEEDFNQVCGRFRITDAGKRELARRVADPHTGGMRRMMKILRKAERLAALAGAEAITQDHIREADGLGLNYHLD